MSVRWRGRGRGLGAGNNSHQGRKEVEVREVVAGRGHRGYKGGGVGCGGGQGRLANLGRRLELGPGELSVGDWRALCAGRGLRRCCR